MLRNETTTGKLEKKKKWILGNILARFALIGVMNLSPNIFNIASNNEVAYATLLETTGEISKVSNQEIDNLKVEILRKYSDQETLINAFKNTDKSGIYINNYMVEKEVPLLSDQVDDDVSFINDGTPEATQLVKIYYKIKNETIELGKSFKLSTKEIRDYYRNKIISDSSVANYNSALIMLAKIEDDVGEYPTDPVEKALLAKAREDFLRLYKPLASKDFGKLKRHNLPSFIARQQQAKSRFNRYNGKYQINHGITEEINHVNQVKKLNYKANVSANELVHNQMTLKNLLEQYETEFDKTEQGKLENKIDTLNQNITKLKQDIDMHRNKIEQYKKPIYEWLQKYEETNLNEKVGNVKKRYNTFLDDKNGEYIWLHGWWQPSLGNIGGFKYFLKSDKLPISPGLYKIEKENFKVLNIGHETGSKEIAKIIDSNREQITEKKIHKATNKEIKRIKEKIWEANEHFRQIEVAKRRYDTMKKAGNWLDEWVFNNLLRIKFVGDDFLYNIRYIGRMKNLLNALNPVNHIILLFGTTVVIPLAIIISIPVMIVERLCRKGKKAKAGKKIRRWGRNFPHWAVKTYFAFLFLPIRTVTK